MQVLCHGVLRGSLAYEKFGFDSVVSFLSCFALLCVLSGFKIHMPLIPVVMCYELFTSNELADTECRLRVEKHRVRFLRVSGHNISSADQYMCDLVYSVFLWKDTLFTTY